MASRKKKAYEKINPSVGKPSQMAEGGKNAIRKVEPRGRETIITGLLPELLPCAGKRETQEGPPANLQKKKL